LFKDVDDSSWPWNGRSLLAEEHTASINRSNINMLFFTLIVMLVTSFRRWASRSRSTLYCFPNNFNCR